MALCDNWVPKNDFTSYEDFHSRYTVNYPENFNFGFDCVDEIARRSPEKEALLWCNPKGDEKRVTFAEMREYSNRAANYFKSLGVKKGDMVMLILKRHYEFWYCIIALHKLGAVAIPATNLLTTKDVVYRANAADVKMIVCTGEGEVASAVDAARPECKTLKLFAMTHGSREGWMDLNEGLNAASPVFERPAGSEEDTKAEDIMLLYFTSGTTGYPKMVWHDFLYPLGHIVTARHWHKIRDGGLHLTISDTGWAKSMWGKLYGQWLSGGTVFVYDFDKFDPKDMLSKIEKYRIKTFCAPPTMYRYFIKERMEDYDLSSLEHVTVAGEPLNPEIFNQVQKRLGLKMYEGYGQTEMTLSVAAYDFSEPRPGSMGKPAPGYDMAILDEEGALCRPGVVGEICIRTDKQKPLGMFNGYYRDDELTQSVWHDGVYHTGDTAWRDEDGYYWYVGRMDDLIKSSGYRIGPFEVESALLEHPAVLEAAITGVPDPDRGAIVKATIVLSQGYEASDELKKTLQEHVKKTTAPYKYPRVIEFVEKLPKTISGKIRRVELRESGK